ncbi:hypothetical protein GCM10025857_35640 [Alicyclobacillus contaminans]|uniref:DUF1292 domain-containing protein n=1 Tax=Alicyclobacillus contaminans TaxID=392016 RepID=UPI0004270FBD|nr:DUF1292 domain-containing protein [Alicyclobacillus contaminans]GMA52207.1 hypothetical protein GCM10025857_35640 [Alicyclobacillus contaminans]
MACACGHDTCSCKTPETIHLMDEAGIVHPFYIADELQIEGQPYAFAVGLEDTEQYALLRVVIHPDGRRTYANIEDEAEWTKIQAFLASVQ